MLGHPSPLRRELLSVGIPLPIYMSSILVSFTAVIGVVTQFIGALRDEPHKGCEETISICSRQIIKFTTIFLKHPKKFVVWKIWEEAWRLLLFINKYSQYISYNYKNIFNTLSRFFSFKIHFVVVTAYLTQKPEKPPKALCLIDQQAKSKTHSSHADVLLHVKAVIISRLNLVTKLSSFRKFVWK